MVHVINTLTPSKIETIKERFTPANHYTDDLGGGCFEHWINVDGSGLLCCLCEYTDSLEDCALIMYGVNINELRTADFLTACITDEDVNHAIQTGAPLPPNINEIVAFVKGETNRLPVTPCGLENYLS